MAGTNDFLAFATGGGADVIAQAAYAALAERTSGFVTGEAQTGEVNKVWRQASMAMALLGKIIADTNRNALDDGNVATLVANLIAALNETLTPQLPPGIYADYAAPTGTPPGKWVLADGALVNRAGTYADLFAVIGTTYNVGGELGTVFRLPDMRGVSRRGLDGGRGLDTGRTMGPAYQTDQNKAHYHLLPQVGDSSCINQYLYGSTDISPTDIATLDNKSSNTSLAARTSSGAESGGTEVRVKNMAARVFISY